MCALVGVLIERLCEMHGATIKIVNAQQAKLNSNYKNTKLKLLKTRNQSVNVFYSIILTRNSAAP